MDVACMEHGAWSLEHGKGTASVGVLGEAFRHVAAIKTPESGLPGKDGKRRPRQCTRTERQRRLSYIGP